MNLIEVPVFTDDLILILPFIWAALFSIFFNPLPLEILDSSKPFPSSLREISKTSLRKFDSSLICLQLPCLIELLIAKLGLSLIFVGF